MAEGKEFEYKIRISNNSYKGDKIIENNES